MSRRSLEVQLVDLCWGTDLSESHREMGCEEGCSRVRTERAEESQASH